MATPQGENFREYGVPIYGAAWAPRNTVIRSTADSNHSDDSKSSGDGDVNSGEGSSNPPLENLILSGGGGVGNTGIRNAVLLTQFDSSADSLSAEPVVRLGTSDDLPYRLAVHPRGDGLVCAFSQSCRWFDWENSKEGKLGLRLSDRVLTLLTDLGENGQQLALAFSEDGSLLGAGGEDGKLRVFKWPSMEILLNEEETYASVKDIHFSIDGRHLVSVGRGGPCRVWDVTTATVVAALPNENDEQFRFCRFSQSSDRDQILYIAAEQGKYVSIIMWNTTSWRRIASKKFARGSVTGFNVSADGKLLAIGTDEGDIQIIDSSNMRVRMTLKKAHRGLVTALTFSRDSRFLGSASMDSSVRVTLVQASSANGSNFWMILLIIILAIAVAYFLKSQGMMPESLPFH